MFKNKKAQGLSLNTIIIASLVLIVLIVLILVFSGRMGIFNLGLNDATDNKACPGDTEPSLPCEGELIYSIGPWKDIGPGEYCCIDPNADDE